MTLNEIKNEVASLGFEKSLSLDSSFLASVRRALNTVYNERTVIGEFRFYQSSPTPSLFTEKVFHEGGEEEVIFISGGYFSLEVCGIGEILLLDKDGERRYPFNASLTRIHDELSGDAELHLLGDFSYTGYGLTVFREKFSRNNPPSLYSPDREYDIDTLVPDFLSAYGLPRDRSGRCISGSGIFSTTLKLPYGYEGEVRVRYKRRAPRVSLDAPDKKLNIEGELIPLIALLTASYVWLDDDADKAAYYASLYREGMAAIKLYSTRLVAEEYSDVTRWA